MKVALCGASSTGKTTLAKILLNEPAFKTKVNKFIFVDGRNLLKLMGCGQMDEMTRNQQRAYQLAYYNEKISSEKKQVDYISDRSFVDIAAYWLVRDTFDSSESEQRKLIDPCQKLSLNYDIHFYLPFGLIEFEKDGYRPENNTFNAKIDYQIKYFLNNWSIEYYTIDVVEITQRIKKVMDIIANLES